MSLDTLLLRNRSDRGVNRRRGTATIELAVCLPLIVLVTFGAVEGASMIFLKQALVQSAYEGAKAAIKPNATNSDVEAATQSVLVGRSLNDSTLEMTPSSIENLPSGTVITISVRAPSASNSLFPIGVLSAHDIEGVAVMVKE